MKLTYTVNLSEAFDRADDATKADILDFVATHDFVIEEVAKQLLGGWTTLCSNGATGFDGIPRTPIDRARRIIAEGASECSKSEIERLSRALHSANDERDYYMKEAQRLRDEINQCHVCQAPKERGK